MTDAERKAVESLFGQQFTPSRTVSGVLSDMLKHWPELLSRLQTATADAERARRLCRELARYSRQAKEYGDAVDRVTEELRNF